MPAMPRPKWPYLLHERSRHGRLVWYVRIERGPRTRIKAEYGTPEFREEYHAAISGEPTNGPQKPAKQTGSMAWAIGLYQDSGAWRKLSKATQRQRANILKRVAKDGGDIPLKAFNKKIVVASYERRAATPAAARNFLETMRGLFKWAVKAEMVKVNPTAGIEAIRVGGGEGFPIWTEEDVAKFEAHWPVGTRPRVALDVLQYTGLRRGDACRLGRPHVKDGIAKIATEKSKYEVWVTLALPPALLATLAAGPCGELTFIARQDGKPYTKESFGNMFKDWCRAAGLNKSAHGLRKAAATRAAEDGYSEKEMDATFGWTGGQMAHHYTRKANREKLSLQAAERVIEMRRGK